MTLRWDQIRPDEGCIFLPNTKNGRSRSVHLNFRAKEVLEELMGRRDQEERTR